MEKTNYKFLLLKVIGIILVLCGHLWEGGGIYLFTNWFPINSFHMALFMFVSGYFYKTENESHVSTYILKKTKTLLLPYFGWNLFYGLLVTILNRAGIIYYGDALSLKTLFVDPWIGGHQFIFNLAAWFVLSLFLVQAIYILLRKLLACIHLRNDFILLCILFVTGTFGIYIANQGFTYSLYLPLVKVLFFLPMYHLGYIYRIKLEQHDRLHHVAYFVILFVIQFILLRLYPNLSYTIAWCTDFNQENILLPFITSITGIAFWLRICSILEKWLKSNKLVYIIGSNTWSIMMHHMFVFFLVNCGFAILAQVIDFGFNYELFMTNPYYSYGNARVSTLYLVAGITVPVIGKWIEKKLKTLIKKGT